MKQGQSYRESHCANANHRQHLKKKKWKQKILPITFALHVNNREMKRKTNTREYVS